EVADGVGKHERGRPAVGVELAPQPAVLEIPFRQPQLLELAGDFRIAVDAQFAGHDTLPVLVAASMIIGTSRRHSPTSKRGTDKLHGSGAGLCQAALLALLYLQLHRLAFEHGSLFTAVPGELVSNAEGIVARLGPVDEPAGAAEAVHEVLERDVIALTRLEL